MHRNAVFFFRGLMSDQDNGRPNGKAQTDEEGAADAHASGQGNGQSNGHATGGNDFGDGGPAVAEAQSAPSGGDELSTLRDRHLRLAAEFDNYRKRVERERADNIARAQAQVLERLLDPLDDLARIADFDPATTPSGALHEGAEMVEKKFVRAMEALGVEEIDAAGKPFDPTIHEALTTVPTDNEDEDNTVAQVFQKGYRLKGVLLRPARVVVRKHGG
jgi:molecular chaperone GrpE